MSTELEVTVHIDDGEEPTRATKPKKKKKRTDEEAGESKEVKDDDRVSVAEEDKQFVPIRNNIEVIKAQTAALSKLNLNATDEKSGKALTKAVEKAMNKANTAGQEIKAHLDHIKGNLKKDKPGAQARANLYNNCCKEFQAVMNEYQTTYSVVRDKINDNKRRQLKNLPTETPLSDEQIESVIASGQEGEVMQRAMMMEDLSNLQDIVADVEERHAEILKLERSVMELLELFRDLSMLVDVQGEKLNIIDDHIANTKKNVNKAEQKLTEAEKAQIAARKKRCYLLMILIFILLVALALGGFFSGIFNSS